MYNPLILLFIIFHMMFAINEHPNEHITLHSIQKDVTGDQLNEYIRLEGEPFQKDGEYFHRVWVNIKSTNTKQWKISLADGYNPKLYILDLNNDHINDLFYQVASNTDSNHVRYKQQLFTLSNGKVETIPLPTPLSLYASLLNNYKILISSGLKEPFLIHHLNKNISFYHQYYNENGKIKNNINLQIKDNLFFEPVWLHRFNSNGLRSSQLIEDIENNIVVGELETTWFYKDNRWIVIETNWRDKNTF